MAFRVNSDVAARLINDNIAKENDNKLTLMAQIKGRWDEVRRLRNELDRKRVADEARKRQDTVVKRVHKRHKHTAYASPAAATASAPIPAAPIPAATPTGPQAAVPILPAELDISDML